MKVYVRKWNGDWKNYVQSVHEIDAYNGLTFFRYGENVVYDGDVHGRVQKIYLHASEPNALCVSVEEVKG